MDAKTKKPSEKNLFFINHWQVIPSQNQIIDTTLPTAKSETKSVQNTTIEPLMMEVLCRLADAEGELVTRQDLQAFVWKGRIVSDAAINRIIARLRKVFSDDAKQPDIIQTVPKKGYRLLAQVEFYPDAIATPSPNKQLTCKNKYQRWHAMVLVSVLLVLLISGWSIVHWLKTSKNLHESVQLTTKLVGNLAELTISPDGRYLALQQSTQGWRRTSIYVQEISSGKLVRVTSGEFHDARPTWLANGDLLYLRRMNSGSQIRRHRINWEKFSIGDDDLIFNPKTPHRIFSVSPKMQSSELIVSLRSPKEKGYSIYSLDKSSQSLTLWKKADNGVRAYIDVTLSPDQTMVAAVVDKILETRLQIFDFTTRKLLYDFPVKGHFHQLDWSRDSQSIIYSVGNRVYQQQLINTSPHIIFKSDNFISGMSVLSETDILLSIQSQGIGIGIYELSNSNAGAETTVAVDDHLLMHPRVSSRNQLAFMRFKQSEYAELMLYDETLKRVDAVKNLPSNSMLHEWSPDGHALIAMTDRVLKIDMTNFQTQYLSPKDWKVALPSWSYDSRWVYFSASIDNQWKLFKVAASGGDPLLVSEEGWGAQDSKDGRFTFYTKRGKSGLIQFDKANGEEKVILDYGWSQFWRDFFVFDSGIYFSDYTEGHQIIRYYDFSSQSVKKVMDWPAHWGTQINFSPDQSQIVFENFSTKESVLRNIRIAPIQ